MKQAKNPLKAFAWVASLMLTTSMTIIYLVGLVNQSAFEQFDKRSLLVFLFIITGLVAGYSFFRFFKSINSGG